MGHLFLLWPPVPASGLKPQSGTAVCCPLLKSCCPVSVIHLTKISPLLLHFLTELLILPPPIPSPLWAGHGPVPQPPWSMVASTPLPSGSSNLKWPLTSLHSQQHQVSTDHCRFIFVQEGPHVTLSKSNCIHSQALKSEETPHTPPLPPPLSSHLISSRGTLNMSVTEVKVPRLSATQSKNLLVLMYNRK